MKDTSPSLFPATVSERDDWILSRRGTRNAVSTDHPYAFLLEQEPAADGELLDIATIFLTGRECPWRCLMCDLWKNTITERTPAGAIPRQIDYALQRLRSEQQPAANVADRPLRQIKLYNSGSFFDRAAVPLEDYPAIARRVAGFERVIVESHPKLIGDLTLRFRDELQRAAGFRQGPECGGPPPFSEADRANEHATKRQRADALQDAAATIVHPKLEVAMGLETSHPGVLEKLNKRFDLDDFSRAAEQLRNNGVALRVFVLVKPPFMDEDEGIEWAVRSADFAFDCGAAVVSLIPTRFGNGALEALADQNLFAPPRLASLETAFAHCLAVGRGRVFVDLWDLEKFSSCTHCFAQRQARLTQMNLGQSVLPVVSCPQCMKTA